jgi:hypothetical protein
MVPRRHAAARARPLARGASAATHSEGQKAESAQCGDNRAINSRAIRSGPSCSPPKRLAQPTPQAPARTRTRPGPLRLRRASNRTTAAPRPLQAPLPASPASPASPSRHLRGSPRTRMGTACAPAPAPRDMHLPPGVTKPRTNKSVARASPLQYAVSRSLQLGLQRGKHLASTVSSSGIELNSRKETVKRETDPNCRHMPRKRRRKKTGLSTRCTRAAKSEEIACVASTCRG